MRRLLHERTLACALGAAISLVLGCEPSPAAPDAAPPPPTTAAPPPPPAEAAAQKPPDDLDVASLQKALKCANDAKSGACGVLAKFATCKPWEPSVPSGDGRWIGRGHVVEGAKRSEQVTLVRSRRVSSSDVGPGQLPVKIAVTDLPKQEGAAFDQADRAIRALERADVPARSNAAMEYVQKRTDWPETSALRTAGGQVYVLSEAGTYLCQSGTRLLVVQRGATRGSNADGLYAELFATTW